MVDIDNSIELKEGEVICPRCKGEAEIITHGETWYCARCNGTGVIDWVSLCMGGNCVVSWFLRTGASVIKF